MIFSFALALTLISTSLVAHNNPDNSLPREPVPAQIQGQVVEFLVPAHQDEEQKPLIACAKDGKSIVAVNRNSDQVLHFDLATRKLNTVPLEGVKKGTRLEILPGGKYIVVKNELFDAVTGKKVLALAEHSGLQLSADAKKVLLTVEPSSLVVYDLATQRAFPPITLSAANLNTVTLSPEGKRAAYLRGVQESPSHEIVICDLATGKTILEKPLTSRLTSYGPDTLSFSA